MFIGHKYVAAIIVIRFMQSAPDECVLHMCNTCVVRAWCARRLWFLLRGLWVGALWGFVLWCSQTFKAVDKMFQAVFPLLIVALAITGSVAISGRNAEYKPAATTATAKTAAETQVSITSAFDVCFSDILCLF